MKNIIPYFRRAMPINYSHLLIITATVIIGMLSSNVRAANPLGIPEYTQTLEITYTTPEEAENAELVKQELPGTKKVAMSARWDDTNNRHLITVQTLAKNGWKGTFYLRNFDSSHDHTMPSQILNLGSTLGSHTLTHPDLTSIHPAGIFKQIIAQRIWEESTYNTCVTAFGLPYSVYRTVFDDAFPYMIGEAIKRSGHLGGAEPWPDVAKRFGLNPEFWTGSYLFNVNDKDPSPELFRTRSTQILEQVTKPDSPNGPHLTLGTHSWQSDAGFVVLGNILKENGNNPDWWYCQENEYIAYRYQFRHTGIRKKSSNGNKVIFELTRISAPELGDNIPLTVRSNGNITSATLDNQPLTVEDNRIDLPQSAGRTIPVVVEAQEFTQDSVEPGQTESFKDIKMTFDEKNNQVSFSCNVPASTKLENTSIILRLPLAWEDGIKRATPTVSNQQLKAQFELGSRNSHPHYQVGDYNFYLQVDTVYDGVPKRLHVALAVPNATSTDTTSPRDNALTVGPLVAGTFTPELLTQISVPNAVLSDFGSSILEKWHSTCPDEFIASYVLAPKGSQGNWNYLARTFCKDKDTEYAFVLEFDATGAEHCKLLLNSRKAEEVVAIYINGQKQEFQQTIELSPLPDRNRIVLVYRVKGTLPRNKMATVSTGDNLFTHVKFLPIKK